MRKIRYDHPRENLYCITFREIYVFVIVLIESYGCIHHTLFFHVYFPILLNTSNIINNYFFIHRLLFYAYGFTNLRINSKFIKASL